VIIVRSRSLTHFCGQIYHARLLERYGMGDFVALWKALLAIAQEAALDGRHEVVLDDHQIADIEAVNLTQVRMPPHMELCFQLQAESRAALRGGETVPPFDAIETNSLTVFAGKTSGCEPLRPLAAVGGQTEGSSKHRE
jgi:hypothetical protein